MGPLLMAYSYKDVAAFLKKAREDMGMTQEDAAIAVGAYEHFKDNDKLTVGMMRQYERGMVLPRLTTMLALCRIYDVSWSSLETVLSASLGETPDLAPAPKNMREIQKLNAKQLQSWRKKRIAVLCNTVYNINSKQ